MLLAGPAILAVYRDLKGSFKGVIDIDIDIDIDVDVDVEVDVAVDIDRCFGCLRRLQSQSRYC